MTEDFCCDWMHTLLSGTYGETNLCDLDSARQHWLACHRCRVSLPEAENHLKFIELEVLRRIRANIEQLYHRHRSSEHNLLASRSGEDLLTPSSTVNYIDRQAVVYDLLEILGPEGESEDAVAEPDESTQRLRLLAEAGEAVQAQLQLMNDNWGLDYFHLLHEDTEYSSTRSGPFIASLPDDIQLFVFHSILALDSIEDCGPEAVALMGSRLYMLIVKAAPAFVKEFSIHSSPVSNTAPEVLGADRDRLQEICDNLEKHFEDVADSLKAGQMEMFRLWEKFGSRASDLEPSLKEHLGLLYARLSETTQRDLQLAENYYSHNQEPDDFTPAILSFHRAYESEFKLRVLAPLVERMRREGMSDHGDDQHKLIVRGQLNRTLTLGRALHYVHNDTMVKKFVTELGLNAEMIYWESSELNNARNDAIHEKKRGREAAARVRSILLKPPSILSYLFNGAVV